MIKSHTGSYTCALERQLPDSDASFFWDTSDSKKKRKGYRDGLKYDAVSGTKRVRYRGYDLVYTRRKNSSFCAHTIDVLGEGVGFEKNTPESEDTEELYAMFDEWIDNNNNNNKTKTEQTYDDRDRNS